MIKAREDEGGLIILDDDDGGEGETNDNSDTDRIITSNIIMS
jgi:hypothetical protein